MVYRYIIGSTLLMILGTVQSIAQQSEVISISTINSPLKSADNNIDRDLPLKGYSWLEELEIRTETNDFEFDRQRYTLRVQPNTFRKKRAENRLTEWQSNKPNADLEELRYEQLEDLYESWINLYFDRKLLTNRLAIEEILRDKEQLYNLSLDKLDFDTKDLVSLLKEKTNTTLSIERLKSSIVKDLSLLSISKEKIQAPLKEIESLLPTLETAPTLESKEASKLAYEVELLHRELDLELAKKNQILDFAQVEYSGPHDDLWNERISVGVAFQLPIGNKRNINVNELIIKKALIEEELSFNQKAFYAEVDEGKVAFTRLVDYHYLLSSTLLDEISKLEKIKQQLLLNNNRDTKLLLDINLRIIQNKDQILLNEKKIYQEYLDILSDSQLLSRPKAHLFVEKE